MKQYSESAVLTADQFDHHGNVFPAVVLDLFQKAAGNHAERLGVGFEAMLAKNLLWVVTQIKYQVLSAPKPAQALTVITWPLPPTRLGFDREYLICDEAGEVLIKGTSKWMQIDAAERKLVPGSNVYPLTEYCTNKNFEEKIRRIRDFEAISAVCRIVPDESTIDSNNHVNNAEYADFAYTALKDFGGVIDSFQIDFLHEVMLGQPLNVGYAVSDAVTLVKGVGEDGERKFSCGIELK
ncbi:MAG: hypothetical protein IKL38_04980 [Firmicutes bacterium]|nr:hypothetical protein [Bacillota bacterium]